MTRVRSAIILFCTLCLIIIPTSEASYALSILPKSEECFTVVTPNKDTTISGVFDFLEDGKDPRELSVSLIETDSGHVMWEARDEAREGIFSVEAKPNKRYSLCFQNENRNVEAEELEVGFNIRVSTLPRTLPDQEAGPDDKRAQEVLTKSGQLLQEWDALEDHFAFMRNREAVHERLTGDIVWRIQRWNLIKAFLVIGVATGQVMYWKKFFETKRYL